MNEINFVWGPFKKQWDDKYLEFKSFYEKEGHLNLPQKEGSLVTWCLNKKSYKKGKLPIYRIKILESIGFAWN